MVGWLAGQGASISNETHHRIEKISEPFFLNMIAPPDRNIKHLQMLCFNLILHSTQRVFLLISHSCQMLFYFDFGQIHF